ncbi:MAG: lipoprotein [Coprothermobacterota bacterium]|nr:lipoprotein [Coprothermobacterota bacterium]
MKRILVVLCCLAILSGCQSNPPPSVSPPTLETSSQSARKVVQQFFDAMAAKDWTKAYQLQTDEFRKEVPLEVFSSSIQMGQSQAEVASQRWEILEETVTGTAAQVSYKVFSTKTDSTVVERQ